MAEQFYDDTVVLLRGNGADGGTVFTDDAKTPMQLSYQGDVKTRTAQFKFGTASMHFFDGGIGGAVTLNDNVALAWSNVWGVSIDCWIYLDSTGIDQAIASKHCTDGTCYSGGNQTYGWTFRVNAANKLEFQWMPANSPDKTNVANCITLTGTTTIAASTWTHVAVVQWNDRIRIFVNGNVEATNIMGVSARPNYTYGTSSGLIGKSGFTAETQFFKGYIDDFRWTKNVRYWDAFTPPSAEADTTMLYSIPNSNRSTRQPIVLPNHNRTISMNL